MDTIPDDQVTLDSPTPTEAPVAQNIPDEHVQLDSNQQQSSTDIPDDQVTLDSDKYGTIGQQIATGLEGAAQGFAGPFATAAEIALGVKPEDIAGRANANPWIHGTTEAAGLAGGLLTGTGEAGLLAKGAEGVAEAANFGKFGSTVLKGALESGVLQGGDELSKAMLGQGDPEAPVSSALAHIGAASLLGGGIGTVVGGASSGLKALADSQLGQKAGQFLEDFGSRLKFNQENPSLVDAVTNELSDFHQSVNEAADNVYGGAGLKAQAIEGIIPQTIHSGIENQVQEIGNTLQNKLAEMAKDTDAYPSRLTKKLESHYNQWLGTVTNPDVTSYQVFNATQDLKQTLQAYSKFDKFVGPLSPEKDFINTAKQLQAGLVKNLEDVTVWGDAGQLQQDINKAFSQFLPAKDKFLQKFTTEELPGKPRVINKGAVNTYVNQLGKPNAEIKQTWLSNYIDSANAYKNKVASLFEDLHLESPIKPTSLNAVNSTLNEAPSAGSKLADYFSHLAASNHGSNVGGAIAGGQGALEGYKENGLTGAVEGGLSGLAAGYLVPLIGKKALGLAGPALIKALASGETSKLAGTLEHAANVQKGAAAIRTGIDALFNSSQKAFAATASDSDREKLRKYVESGQLNQQIQAQASKPRKAAAVSPQHFAEGGDVKGITPLDSDIPSTPVKPLLDGTSSLSIHMPEQAMLMSAAKGRINQYLNSVRPQENANKLPFDESMKDPQRERSYNRALDLANQPLSILQHVQDGTITPEHVQHFTGMYPELYNHLSKKITEKISESQLKDEKPTYKVRQGLSLLLGAPMDSTFTPGSIQAAQNVFVAKSTPAPNTPITKNKKNTSKLGEVSKQYQTADQARQARQNS